MKTKIISILVLSMFILGPATSQAAHIINVTEETNTQLQLKEQIAILWQEVTRLMALLVAIQETQSQLSEEDKETTPRDPRYIPASEMTGEDEESEVDVSTTTQDAWYPELECQQREAQKLPHLRLMCP